jgi:Domain of unknown function (DUF4833)
LYFKIVIFCCVNLISFCGIAQKKSKNSSALTFPIPPDSPIRLFYIQRSNNANTVIYDANILKNGQLNPQNPVHSYWIRYADGGKIEELSTIQRTLAYGLHTNKVKEMANTFEGYFFAYRKRKFLVKLNAENEPIALFQINGKMQILDHVWVQVEEAGLTPKIPYIELFGRDVKTGAVVYEKFKP